jgi:SAM-dependent methyltransferase
MGLPSTCITHRDTTGWCATIYNNVAPFVYSPEATAPILRLLEASPGDRVLDLGCGSGEVTAEIMRLVQPKGIVVGVDLSQSMVITIGSWSDIWTLIASADHESSRNYHAF